MSRSKNCRPLALGRTVIWFCPPELPVVPIPKIRWPWPPIPWPWPPPPEPPVVEDPESTPWDEPGIVAAVGHLFDPTEHVDVEGIRGGSWSRDLARVTYLLAEIQGIENERLRSQLEQALVRGGSDLAAENVADATFGS